MQPADVEESYEDVLAWSPFEAVRDGDGYFDHAVWERLDGCVKADSAVVDGLEKAGEPSDAVDGCCGPEVIPVEYQEK